MLIEVRALADMYIAIDESMQSVNIQMALIERGITVA